MTLLPIQLSNESMSVITAAQIREQSTCRIDSLRDLCMRIIRNHYPLAYAVAWDTTYNFCKIEHDDFGGSSPNLVFSKQLPGKIQGIRIAEHEYSHPVLSGEKTLLVKINSMEVMRLFLSVFPQWEKINPYFNEKYTEIGDLIFNEWIVVTQFTMLSSTPLIEKFGKPLALLEQVDEYVKGVSYLLHEREHAAIPADKRICPLT